LVTLYESGHFADVSFFVEDKIIKCHKVILSSRCEYFARMFLSGLMESTTNEVPVYDTSPEVFETVIKVRKYSEKSLKYQGFVFP
jgi:hypothetical protein